MACFEYINIIYVYVMLYILYLPLCLSSPPSLCLRRWIYACELFIIRNIVGGWRWLSLTLSQHQLFNSIMDNSNTISIHKLWFSSYTRRYGLDWMCLFYLWQSLAIAGLADTRTHACIRFGPTIQPSIGRNEIQSLYTFNIRNEPQRGLRQTPADN